MNYRSLILDLINTNLASTSARVSSELPWITGGVPLHQKNKGVIYLDTEQFESEPLELTLDNNDVYVDTVTVEAFLVVDAKNTPSDISTILDVMRAARRVGENHIHRLCNVETTIQDDEITYTFTYEFRRVNNP